MARAGTLELLGDSAAYRNQERVLSQHQAAITLLQHRLSNPSVGTTRWLDLACGRGQILGALDRNLSQRARASLEYWGYDISSEHLTEAQRIAEGLELAEIDFRVGDIGDFDRLYDAELQFDFVTLTNAVHELPPHDLAAVLVAIVLRLSDRGTLFIYDVESIRPPELGAVPWRWNEVRRIVRCLLDALGAVTYQPEIGQWVHSSCVAWNLQLQRNHFGVAQADAEGKRDNAVDQASKMIVAMLVEKHDSCCEALETLTRYGAETAEEEETRLRLLYELWAVSRALESVK